MDAVIDATVNLVFNECGCLSPPSPAFSLYPSAEPSGAPPGEARRPDTPASVTDRQTSGFQSPDTNPTGQEVQNDDYRGGKVSSLRLRDLFSSLEHLYSSPHGVSTLYTPDCPSQLAVQPMTAGQLAHNPLSDRRDEQPDANFRLSEDDVGRVVSAMAREVLQIVNENVEPKEFGFGLGGLPEGPAYKRGRIACKTAWCMNNRLSHNLSSLDNPTDTGVGAPGRKRRDTS
ncbi:hypothetical protein Bbelb_363420 [Branchiostoma belcheri]|nr:hypothetical protein Bbelb_363420 [Branchiostoma belcheri]